MAGQRLEALAELAAGELHAPHRRLEIVVDAPPGHAAESFNGRPRDELLAMEEFGTLLEAEVVVEAWRVEYNTHRPHSSLDWLCPAACAVQMCEPVGRMPPLAVYRPQWRLCWDGFEFGCLCSRPSCLSVSESS